MVEALALLRNDSPAIICSRLKESLSRYEAAVKGVDETYLRLEEEQEDERTYQEWTAKHSEYLKPKEDKIAEVVNRISEWEAAAYAAHAQAIRDSPRQGVQAGPREPQAKAVDALRPDCLEEDTDHLAFSSFKDKYRRYFNASFNKSVTAGIPAVGAERQPRHQDQSRGHRLAGSLPDQT